MLLVLLVFLLFLLEIGGCAPEVPGEGLQSANVVDGGSTFEADLQQLRRQRRNFRVDVVEATKSDDRLQDPERKLEPLRSISWS